MSQAIESNARRVLKQSTRTNSHTSKLAMTSTQFTHQNVVIYHDECPAYLRDQNSNPHIAVNCTPERGSSNQNPNPNPNPPLLERRSDTLESRFNPPASSDTDADATARWLATRRLAFETIALPKSP